MAQKSLLSVPSIPPLSLYLDKKKTKEIEIIIKSTLRNNKEWKLNDLSQQSKPTNVYNPCYY